MPRPYHSSSSVELIRACEYAGALRYIEGWKEPEVTWDEIEAGAPHESRQRSLALGKAMHAQAEAWLRGEDPPYAWESVPGQVFQSGIHHLPAPDGCWFEVEAGIGDVPLNLEDPNAPTTAIEIHGVLWAGFVDYRVIPGEDELERLGLEYPPGGILTIDHKSSSDIQRWAKTAEDLQADVQASVYAVDTCRRFGLDRMHGRWVYYQTKGARRSRAVDFSLTLERALKNLEEPAEIARKFDRLVTVEQATMNMAACEDYGGRPCHQKRGGPCTARRSLRERVVALRRKKEMKQSSFQQKFGKPEVVPQDVTPIPETSEAPAKATRRARPAKKAAKKIAEPKLPEDSLAAKVVEITSRLKEAELGLLTAEEEYETAVQVFESAQAAVGTARETHEAIKNELREALK